MMVHTGFAERVLEQNKKRFHGKLIIRLHAAVNLCLMNFHSKIIKKLRIERAILKCEVFIYMKKFQEVILLSFKILKFNCCRLDVHKTWIYACIGITDSNNRTEYKQARFSSLVTRICHKRRSPSNLLIRCCVNI